MLKTIVIGYSLLLALLKPAAPPLQVLLIDGESGGPYHKWQLVTAVLKKQLEETGLFQVTVATATPQTAATEFKPDFSRYRVVVMNYDAPDERWSAETKTSFEQYVNK